MMMICLGCFFFSYSLGPTQSKDLFKDLLKDFRFLTFLNNMVTAYLLGAFPAWQAAADVLLRAKMWLEWDRARNQVLYVDVAKKTHG